MRVVVTGATRGIGLELVRQLVSREATVDATARRPHDAHALHALELEAGGRLHVHPCDVGSDESVAAFARALGDDPVDILINNAGKPPVRDCVDAIEPAERQLETMNVNAFGPLRISQALLPRLLAGRGRRIVHIGSILGSIADVTAADAFGYRMSKAALNMVSRILATGLREERIISVVIHPGWVRTEMGGPRAPVPVEDSAAGILAVVERLQLHHSGQFLDFRGRHLRW